MKITAHSCVVVFCALVTAAAAAPAHAQVSPASGEAATRRIVPRATTRRAPAYRRATRCRDVAGAHSAHARFRADDEHRVSDEARRARSRRGVSRAKGAEAAPPRAHCAAERAIMSALRGRAGRLERHVCEYPIPEVGGRRLDCGTARQAELKWAYGFAGDIIAFAAPTVVNGTLFVGSAGGAVQALDAETGCLHWHFRRTAPCARR